MQMNETELLSYTIHKSKLKMDQRPGVIILKENISNHFFDIGHGNIFLDMSPLARETKAKLDYWNYKNQNKTKNTSAQ